ncbi:aldo/keto reductase [Enterococcus cecorum]|uniref:aldo/keto reductase n=1 Tax=Enterococcus cecorum TaxID=44008 RepID=UPI001FAD7501|nr:aldo/keto reductase [Enterococcus cecorum]MCJ0536415.1 aldo/keto reductase [Enterococcus cecorum]MCJ0546896.1 aldo/keto reductase [Enterococcus cecorum]MCJ0550643.1 aldo/keto reductase [Enterococcus cecorum]MCJ0569796.1 aldo/keto reductase [Enterococcus cecorum]
MKVLAQDYVLNNGVKMPKVGLGVFKVSDEKAAEIVKEGIMQGYRLIDTAAIYGNESGTGRGIKAGLAQTGLEREDIFVTSKLWSNHLTYEETIAAFEESLTRLELDYLDLYLIHWPGVGEDAYKESWLAIEHLYQEGKIRAIGVSNFQVHHLERLASYSTIQPTVNQIELHPRLTQTAIRKYAKDHGIQIQAWSPLMQGQILDNEVLVQLAEKYQKSVAQIIFKWDVQQEIALLTKTERKERLTTNAQLDDFELSQADIELIAGLNQDLRVGPDPETFDFA